MENTRPNTHWLTLLLYWVIAYVFLLLLLQIAGRDLSLAWVIGPLNLALTLTFAIPVVIFKVLAGRFLFDRHSGWKRHALSIITGLAAAAILFVFIYLLRK